MKALVMDYPFMWACVRALETSGTCDAPAWYRDTINYYYCQQRPNMLVHSDSLGDPLAIVEMQAVNYQDHFWPAKG